VTVTVQRASGEQVDLKATLHTKAEIDAGSGSFGVTITNLEMTGSYFQRNPIDAFGIAIGRTVSALGLILGGLGALVSSIATHPTEAPPVSGPVGIAVTVGQVFWQLGPIPTLYLMGILSANLALVNVLPFPPLDGGRMAVITIKRFAGKRLSAAAERGTYFVGFALLMGLLLWVTFFDILRQITGAGA
jgi:regulator of sigma E protease